jgi:hypothetical protein
MCLHMSTYVYKCLQMSTNVYKSVFNWCPPFGYPYFLHNVIALLDVSSLFALTTRQVFLNLFHFEELILAKKSLWNPLKNVSVK